MNDMIIIMKEIIKGHGGECAIEQLLLELQSYDEYIDQSEIIRVIRDYPTIFQWTTEINWNGKTIVEGGVALTGDW